MDQKSLIQGNMYPIIEFKFITMLHIESNASEKSNSKKSWFLVRLIANEATFIFTLKNKCSIYKKWDERIKVIIIFV